VLQLAHFVRWTVCKLRFCGFAAQKYSTTHNLQTVVVLNVKKIIMNNLISSVLRLWNGEARLSFAFWGVFFPIFFFNCVLSEFDRFFPIALRIIIFSVFLTLDLFCMFVLWRCSSNSVTYINVKKYLVRCFVLLNITFKFFGVIVLFKLFG
jgi:hypothetical protein